MLAAEAIVVTSIAEAMKSGGDAPHLNAIKLAEK